MAWIAALACGNEGPLAPDGEQEWASVAPESEPARPSRPPPASAPDARVEAESRSAPLVRVPPDEFEIIDPGREPRATIRYQHRAGEVSTTRTRLSLSLKATSGGRSVRLNVPVQMDVRSKTLAVDAAGNARRMHHFTRASVFDFSATGATVTKETRSLTEDFINRIEHLQIVEVVDARGVLVEAQARVSDDADPMLRESVGDLQDALGESMVPWPEQAIGPGARWRRKKALVDEHGVKYDQEVITTLVSRDGARVEASSELLQRAPRQSFTLRSGVPVDLEQLETRASASSRILLAPFAVKSRTRADSTRAIVLQGERLSVSSTMTLELSTLGKQF